MESTLQNPALDARSAPKGILIAFWIFTAIFCLEMLFTAYNELMVLPQASEAFRRLGFSSAAFRIELSWAKVAGVLALLLPFVPARLKEWAYAGASPSISSRRSSRTIRSTISGWPPFRPRSLARCGSAPRA